MKVATGQKLDADDARRLREMVDSKAFRAFADRIETELVRHRKTCCSADSEMELRRAQGAVQALVSALALPERMIEEIRNAGDD